MKSPAEQSSALTFIDRAGHARHPRKKPPCGLSLPRLRPFSFLVTRKREIEAGAKRRLADEYDVAQERGEVVGRTGGGDITVPVRNAATAADIGLTRKQIHEARAVRNAAQPDVK
jgi:hypothetical protein